MTIPGNRLPAYQTLAASISALSHFWENRLEERSLRMKFGLDEAQFAAGANEGEPFSVSLINSLVVKDNNKTRSLTDAEMLLLKTALKPYTPFTDSWLTIDLNIAVAKSAMALFTDFLNEICKQFKAEDADINRIRDWNGWKTQLFEHGVLTQSNLNRAIDEKLSQIFEIKLDTSDISEARAADILRTINEISTLIIRSSGWKLMQRMQP